MPKEDLQKVSTPDLQKKQKALIVLTTMLAGTLLVLIILAIIQTFSKGIFPLLAVPLALLPILILNFSTVGRIKKELKSREL